MPNTDCKFWKGVKVFYDDIRMEFELGKCIQERQNDKHKLRGNKCGYIN